MGEGAVWRPPMLIEYMGICVLNLTLGSIAKVSAYLHMVNNYLRVVFL